MTEKASEILNRAADEIQKYGWTTGVRGWYREEGAGLCIEGGIIAAMGTTHDDINVNEFRTCPAYQAVASYLGITEEDDLFDWNDSAYNYKGRGAKSGEHVIAVLRGAALVEASKEEAAEVARA